MNTAPLTPTAARLLAHLRMLGPTSASNGALAHDLACSVTALKDGLARLEEDGLVQVDRRRRNRHDGDATGRTLTFVRAAQKAPVSA